MAHETYIRHTDGKKAVLFIHGFLGSPEHFEKFIERVPESYGVYNILLEGHGGTVKDFGRASMEKWKNQVKEAVDSLLERYSELIICGHSMGTFLAMDEAIRNPGRVTKLFLLAIPLKIHVMPEAMLNTLKTFFNLGAESEKARMYKSAHSVKLNMKLWEYIGWIPRYLELFKASFMSRDTILKLREDTVIYMSRKDELVSFKSVKFIPGSENIKLNVLPHSAHFIYDAADMTQMLEGFSALFDEI